MKQQKKKTFLWQANIELPSGAVAPDSFEGQIGSVPRNDFVVARDRKGNPVSTFGDWTWNYTAYHPYQKTFNLYIRPWDSDGMTARQKRLAIEIRYIFFSLIYMRHGPSLAVSTLMNNLNALKSVARFAHDNGHRVADVFSHPKVLHELLRSAPKSRVVQCLPSIFMSLMAMDDKVLGFKPLGGKSIKELREAKRNYETGLKQHPPLPPRIYSQLIANTMQELKKIDAVLDSFLDVIRTACRLVDGHYTGTITIHRGGYPLYDGKLEKEIINGIIAQKGLAEFFTTRSWSFDRDGLASCLGHIVQTCQLAAHIFSGARREEILQLPYDCVEKRCNYGRTDYLLYGSTTKFNNSRVKQAYWVTCKEGAYAVDIATKIADAIYEYCGAKPGRQARSEKYPLFVSPTYLPITKGSKKRIPDGFAAAGVRFAIQCKDVLDLLLPQIEEADLKDLEQIDPHRAWLSEKKFRPGQRWPFVKHQLRRSLALYAQASGLVRLPSLRRQLQHLTEQMSRYYARGSAESRRLVSAKKGHFAIEWQNASSDSQHLAWIANVLFADERLFGGQGAFTERRKKRGDIKVLKDREVTRKRFAKGEMAHTDTPLGGCLKAGPCDQRAMRSLVGCIECPESVLKRSKVRLVVNAMRAQLPTMDPSSIEYRAELHDIQILDTALNRMD